jgi:hypothetical protein
MKRKTYVVVLMSGILLGTASSFGAPPREESSRNVTFNKDVLPIVQQNCQNCHRPGQIGPFSLLTYKEARPFAKAIKQAVAARVMPPWFADPNYGHFDNDRSLKQSDIDTIVSWVDGGAPEGDPKDAPPPRQWPSRGFQIQPDAVVELPPFEVPARGVLDWYQIAIPAPFKEDTWVTSIEVVPGEPTVVHHFCMAMYRHQPSMMYNTYEWTEVPRDNEGITSNRGANPKEVRVASREVGSTVVKHRIGRQFLPSGGNADFCYLPGLPYQDYRPNAAAVFVPAGSDIVLSLHYTTSGLAVTDRTKIGFTIAKAPPAKQLVFQGGEGDLKVGIAPIKLGPSRNNDLAIPPFEANYVGPLQEMTFTDDVELVSLIPHAHVRGKSAQYKLVYPDGREEIVLNVPHYDFNWQLMYRTSLKIPKGSKMVFQFTYDNSPANKYNPDASKWVYYGQQSWEEMGSPIMAFVIDRKKTDK